MLKISSLAFVLLCASVAVASTSTSQPGLFQRWCKSNQRYHQCKPCHWDCKDRYSRKPCPAVCESGCACPVGTYWNKIVCVKPALCPNTRTCPGNQVYYGFCQRPCHFTCDQANQNNFCTTVCRPPGCACPSGLFWNGELCVTRSQCHPCPPGVPYHHCTKDPCTTAVCHRYPNAECRANYCGGCNAEFYVNNKLVKDCDCPANQIFYKRCKPCPKHCDHIENPVFCRQACAPGCGCPAHTYWNGKKCVSRDQCLCPSNQIYYSECKPCQSTCENPNPICPAICKPGCACPRGLTWDGKQCIKPDQCDCPANQIYYSGCKPCQSTCDNPNPICPAVCLPGCACPKGLTLKGKKCIRPDSCGPCPPGVPVVNCLVDPCQFAKCPRFPGAKCVSNFCGGCNHDFFIGGRKIPKEKCVLPKCEGNQIYYSGCKPCQSTCDNPHPVCPAICKPGCACRKGLTLKGKQCIPPTQCGPCPPGVPVVNCLVDPCQFAKCKRFPEAKCVSNYCGGCNHDFFIGGRKIPKEKCECEGNQIYYSGCKPCQSTCDNPHPVCTLDCKPGCACRKGLTLKGKQCIAPSQCGPCPPGVPLVQCVIDPCEVNSCPRFPEAVCRANYCGGCNAEFFIGNRKISDEKCQCRASLNEQFRTCAPPCDATCDEPRKECSLQERCTRRCACRTGYLRNNKNVCVRPSQCPTKKCNPTLNEHFRSCAAPCDATCKEPLKPCSLLKICTSRCACYPKYVRNNKNVCVPASQCSKCPNNQVYKSCVNCIPKCPGPIALPKVCLPHALTTYPCTGKCTCPFGLFMNYSGRCVPIGQCPLVKG